MRRRKSPIQQWVDSLPPPEKFGNSDLGSVTDVQSIIVDSVPSPAKSTASTSGSIIENFCVPVDSDSISIPICTVEKVFSDKENFINHSNMTVSEPIVVPTSPSISCSGVSR